MITIHDLEQGSPAWHEIRKDKVTGSIAYILLAKGLEEAIAKNSKRAFKGNYYTDRGHVLEHEAIELYEQINDVSVGRFGFITNELYPNAGASPDGIADNVLLEVKCFNGHRMMKVGKYIPFEVRSQLQFNMLICDLPYADLVLYNPDLADEDAFKQIREHADKRIHANIIRKLKGE